MNGSILTTADRGGENGVKLRLKSIVERIRIAAEKCGRDPSSVRMVAVSKTQPAETVRKVAETGGITLLGENYIQEARDKIEALSDLNLTWHFIGHLQSNKAKIAVGLFDLIHSVDSVKLARELSKQAAKIGKTQQILIQVNIGQEASKSGTMAHTALDLVHQMAALDHIRIRGLMTMPPFFDSPERVRPFFSALRQLRDKIATETIPGVSMTELSMGMTGDFEAAIEEGATLVRIGTALFGPR
ncbi:MAG: YggS family pyridoxal phosphate-dependent enzyme [Desulfobacterales bacterium]|nr:YggS family pyridoxal phosphate-dependent enzyme [Desulfobacterales bacterium]